MTAFFYRHELDFSQITTAIMLAFAACRRELKGLDLGPKTWDPKGGTLYPRPRTQLIVGTQDLRPGTLKVGPETWDTYFTWDLRPRRLKEGSGTLVIGETQDSKQRSLVKPGTQEL